MTENDVEENDYGMLGIIPAFAWKEPPQTTSERIADFRTDIKTRDLPNMTQKRSMTRLLLSVSFNVIF
jgi:hypothetical protein